MCTFVYRLLFYSIMFISCQDSLSLPIPDSPLRPISKDLPVLWSRVPSLTSANAVISDLTRIGSLGATNEGTGPRVVADLVTSRAGERPRSRERGKGGRDGGRGEGYSMPTEKSCK